MKLGSPAAMSKEPPSGPVDARSVVVSVEDLESENARLRKAVEALLKLIGDGDLVRNIEGDGDFPRFMSQGIRIGKTLSDAQEALSK